MLISTARLTMTFKILRKAVSINENEVKNLKSIAQHAHCIFNPDKKRKQAKISTTHPFIRKTEKALARHGLMYGRLVGDCVVLHSKAKCKKQRWHTDYRVADCAVVRRKPLGVLVAIEDDTKLDMYDAGAINLAQGDVLVFQGDCVHAGSEYRQANTRVHLYVDTPTVLRPKDTTFYHLDQ